MRSIILATLLVSLSIHGFSQTRDETEKWLKFYLDKFSNRPARDLADVYYFDGNFLVRTDDGEMQSMRNWKAYHINMAKVKKVEYAVDRTTDIGNFQNPCFTVTLYLNGDDSCLFVTDGESRRVIAGPSPAGMYILHFFDPEVLKNNMPERLTKALEHLATVEGAPVIKEVF